MTRKKLLFLFILLLFTFNIFAPLNLTIARANAIETHDIVVLTQGFEVNGRSPPVTIVKDAVVPIAVVAENSGTVTETFNVTVYYNDTFIETKTVSNLTAKTNTSLTFAWNTVNVMSGAYKINVTASSVPGETDTEDNTFVSRTVTVIPSSMILSHITVIPQSTVNENLTPGDNYTVSIYTDYNGSDVWSYQFILSYDPNILHGGINKTDTWTGNGTTTYTTTEYTTTEYPVHSPEKISVNGSNMRKATEKTDTWTGNGTTTYTTTEYPVHSPEKIYVNGSSMRKVTDKTDTWTGNNVTKTFFATETPLIPSKEDVFVNGTELFKDLDYVIDYVTGNITIFTAPASGVEVKAVYDYGDYTLGYETGVITFTIAPGVGAAIKANYYYGGVVNGDLINKDKNPSALFIAGSFNNTSGELELTGAFFFFIFPPAPLTSGPGTLANVTFTVVGTGETNITLGPETMLIGYTPDGWGDQYFINAESNPNYLQHGYFKNAEGGDVAITNVMQWFKDPPIRVIDEAYSTWPINLNVTIENVGSMTVNCTVTVYYDSIPIATQNATDLVTTEIRTLTLTGDITGLDPGVAPGVFYTLKANATIIALPDLNLANNEFAYGTVKIRRWGDVTNSDTISILDLKKVKLAYSGIINEPFADVNGDCQVNILDLKLIKLIFSSWIPPILP